VGQPVAALRPSDEDALEGAELEHGGSVSGTTAAVRPALR
jgi:hypothetical protein